MFFNCLPCCGDPCCNITDGMGHAVTNLFTGSSPPSVGDTYTSPTMTGEYNVSNWYFYDIDFQDGEAFISPEGFGGPDTVPPAGERGAFASAERSPYIRVTWPGLTDVQFSANAAALRECNHLYGFNVFFGRRSKYLYGAPSIGSRYNNDAATFGTDINVSSRRVYAGVYFNFGGLHPFSRSSSSFRITSISFSGQQINFSTQLSNYGNFHLDSELVSPVGGSVGIDPLQWATDVTVAYELRVPFFDNIYNDVGLEDGWVVEVGSFDNTYGLPIATLSGTSTFSWPEGFGLYPQDLCN